MAQPPTQDSANQSRFNLALTGGCALFCYADEFQPAFYALDAMTHLWPWMVTMLFISMSPGAGAVASMSSGATHGWRRGIWTAVGQQLALLLFLLISALGLASLLASVPASISALTLLGSAYLAWLGMRLLYAAFRRRDEAQEPVARRPARQPIPSHPGGMVLHGFFVNASNPKALLALFVITPRFIDPARSLSFQYCLIAASMVAIDLIVMGGYTAIGSRILRSLGNDSWRRRTDAFFGCLFFIAAVLVAKS